MALAGVFVAYAAMKIAVEFRRYSERCKFIQDINKRKLRQSA